MKTGQPWVWFVGCLLAMLAIALVSDASATRATSVAGGGASGAHAAAPAFWLLRAAGAALVIAGVALNAAAMAAFRRHGTSMDPDEAPRALVEDGPYRRTRNPMYLAGILILLGVLLVSGEALAAPVPALYALVAARGFVPSDERRMHALFGDAWRDYASRVPRWL